MFGKKIMNVFALAMLMMSLVAGFVTAETVGLNVDYVEVNGHKVADNERIEVRLGETLDIEVKLSTLLPEDGDKAIEDVQIQAIMVYEYSQHDDSANDMTNTFDLQFGSTTVETLSVKVPVKMETEDNVYLQLVVFSKYDDSYIKKYKLDIKGVEREDAVMINEAYLSPNAIQAGRGTKVTVKAENYGDKDLDDVTLLVRVPALNLQDVETLDEIEAGEKETFENLVLRIPSNAVPGVYEITYTLKFDEYESTTVKDVFTVLPSEEAQAQDTSKTMITVPNTQSIVAGATGVAYPVVIANMGNQAKAYQLTVQGVDAWGTARIDPTATVIVPAGQTVTAFLYVDVNANAEAGDKVFQLTVSDGSKTEQIPLTAKIVESNNNDWSGLKKVLEVGLIILVIILIIIGLIVGFNKLRKSNDEEDEDKTYY